MACSLNSYLPPPPSRLLVVGSAGESFWNVVREPRREIQWAERIDAAEEEEGTFDGVLWYAWDPSQSTSGVIQTARKLLNERGTLIVVTPVHADNGQESLGERGFLPPKEEENLRRILLGLSEAGFSFRKSQELAGSLPGQPRRGKAHPCSVVVARKDPFLIRSYRDGDEQKIVA